MERLRRENRKLIILPPTDSDDSIADDTDDDPDYDPDNELQPSTSLERKLRNRHIQRGKSFKLPSFSSN
jgi:hypothetical protein